MTHQTLPNHIDKFRLGIYMGDFSQPISLMRCVGPFAAMTREDPRLELVFPAPKADGADVGWTWLARCDAIFYSHPNTDLDLSVLWLARTMGVPVWSEYVDDIFNVLPTNPHYQMVKNNPPRSRSRDGVGTRFLRNHTSLLPRRGTLGQKPVG